MRRNALRPTHRDAVEYISYDYAALIAPTTPAKLRTYDYAELIVPTVSTQHLNCVGD